MPFSLLPLNHKHSLFMKLNCNFVAPNVVAVIFRLIVLVSPGAIFCPILTRPYPPTSKFAASAHLHAIVV